ncbi:MAG: hypothetical protein JSV52_07665 [Candidatus Zixiibacteriota bacterium]|nr:MAG: hypothetical protein JSV52_07665 [candidate division Zixibacteria bacterium]
MKIRVLLAALLLSVAPMVSFVSAVVAQDFYPAIYVDVNEVEGLVHGQIPNGGTITIPIRFVNVDELRTSISNGYRFYSDNVTWTGLAAAWNPNHPWDWNFAEQLGCIPVECAYFDLGLFVDSTFYGPPADTVGFIASAHLGTGLPTDFDDIAYTITVTGISGNQGEVLTLDSSWCYPIFYWLWSGVDDQVWWGGPYEFEIGPRASIWVDPAAVGGLTEDGKIPIGGTDLTIPIRFSNSFDARTAILNGFVLQSEDIVWQEITLDWNSAYPWDYHMSGALGVPDPFFDYGVYVDDKNLSGPPADTVSLAGFAGAFGTGLPSDFDDAAYTLTVMGVGGDARGTLTLDSTSWTPARNWMWSGVQQEVGWGGPYVFEVESPDPAYTTCWPQPTILKAPENDGILNVSIHNEENYDVVLESIRVQGKIPPLTEARIDGDSIITDCDLMRFLGTFHIKPIPPEGFQDKPYTVEYDKTDGSHVILTGGYWLFWYPGDILSYLGQCDLNSDGAIDSEDVRLIKEYLWDGQESSVPAESFDVNGDGLVDVIDLYLVMMSSGMQSDQE